MRRWQRKQAASAKWALAAALEEKRRYQ